jgi:hypothetical protein
MRTSNLLTIIIVLIAFSVNAQVIPWTKDARNMAYNELLNDLTTFKSLPQDQKESIALCGLDEITKKYSMAEYQAKIDIETRRIKSATIGICSKNLGISLEATIEKPADKQVDTWSKESKSNVYNDAMNIFSKYELTQQQREALSLCYTDEITKNYSKIDLDNLIEAELKKVRNEYIKKCLDKNNITLKKSSSDKLSIKGLAGCWQSYDFSVCFYETGELEKRMDKGMFKKTKGKWFIEADKILFILKDIKEEYKVLYNSGESLKLEESSTKKELHFTKIINF